MRFIFVRHGRRERFPKTPDAKQGLSAEGADDVRKLKRLLGTLEVVPTACFSSEYLHAQATAILLTEGLARSPIDVVTLKCLTPKAESEGSLAFVTEAKPERFGSDDVILIVGHEPRLAQLVGAITATRGAPLPRASALAVEASSYEALLVGQCHHLWRWPVESTRSVKLEEKLSAKMEVSGVLAGLTIAVGAVLLDAEKMKTSIWHVAAILLLTAGAALFVASLYVYDRLMMPEAFWIGAAKDDDAKIFGSRRYKDDRNANGVVYAEMVWTWKWVFSPALALAAAGYVMMLADIGERNGVLAIGAAIVALAFLFYGRVKPRLGVD